MYGISDMKSSEVELIYNGDIEYKGITYQLSVMNNGQVFLCSNEVVSMSENRDAKGSVLGTTYTRRFESGDFTGYTVWEVTYVISQQYYDHIKSHDMVGANGVSYFYAFHEKLVEDADSPAYVGIGNAKTSSGLYYDMGVAVGRNKATVRQYEESQVGKTRTCKRRLVIGENGLSVAEFTT